MKIKVCGITLQKQMIELDNKEIDFIGLNFYPQSKRFVQKENTKILSHTLAYASKVGVFVNHDLNKIYSLYQDIGLDFIQLHGFEESVEYCTYLKKWGLKIIKVIPSHPDFFNSTYIRSFEKVVEYILFDTYTKEFGGSGKQFYWGHIQQLDFDIPYFLSGGISYDDIQNIIQLKKKDIRLMGVDINSHFETDYGIKDMRKIVQFKEKLGGR